MENSLIQDILFYGFAIPAVVLALAVVLSHRILRAAVYLTAVLVTSAAFYLMLGMEFLAAVQILVYVGGIVILLVFAVMLTGSVELREESPSKSRMIVGASAAIGFMVLNLAVFSNAEFAVSSASQVPDDVRAIGLSLLDYGGNGHLLPFELISLLLLSALVGGIVIARKTPEPCDEPATAGGEQS